MATALRRLAKAQGQQLLQRALQPQALATASFRFASSVSGVGVLVWGLEYLGGCDFVEIDLGLVVIWGWGGADCCCCGGGSDRVQGAYYCEMGPFIPCSSFFCYLELVKKWKLGEPARREQ